MRQGGGRGGAIQGKEGIKFCHLATLSSQPSEVNGAVNAARPLPPAKSGEADKVAETLTEETEHLSSASDEDDDEIEKKKATEDDSADEGRDIEEKVGSMHI